MVLSIRKLLAAVCVVAVAGVELVQARSSVGDRVLVVLEAKLSKADYSSFWAELEGRGYELTFRAPKDTKPALVVHDVPQFEHLIVFAPSTKTFHESLSPQAIIAAQTTHKLNTLFLASPSLSEQNRDFAREYDIEFEPREHVLIDYFGKSEPSTIVISSESSLFKSPAAPRLELPIVAPNAVAHKLGLNPLLLPVLNAPEGVFSGEIVELDDEEREVEALAGGKNKEVLAGSKASLVSGFQTRENARAGWIGSVDMLSDKTLKTQVEVDGKTTANGNAAFIRDFTSWVFQETGVIKVVDSTHYKAGETEPREMYRIKDELTFELTLAQHATSSNKTSRWAPFSASDIQLDFTMLDPHVRTALKEASSSTSSTTYKSTFIAPDRHGVFKFVVEYWRPGYSFIRTSTTAPVVPFRHDEYPRFITGAWPYYLSTASIVAAFGLFCALWLTTAEDKVRGGKKIE